MKHMATDEILYAMGFTKTKHDYWWKYPVKMDNGYDNVCILIMPTQPIRHIIEETLMAYQKVSSWPQKENQI